MPTSRKAPREPQQHARERGPRGTLAGPVSRARRMTPTDHELEAECRRVAAALLTRATDAYPLAAIVYAERWGAERAAFEEELDNRRDGRTRTSAGRDLLALAILRVVWEVGSTSAATTAPSLRVRWRYERAVVDDLLPDLSQRKRDGEADVVPLEEDMPAAENPPTRTSASSAADALLGQATEKERELLEHLAAGMPIAEAARLEGEDPAAARQRLARLRHRLSRASRPST